MTSKGVNKKLIFILTIIFVVIIIFIGLMFYFSQVVITEEKIPSNEKIEKSERDIIKNLTVPVDLSVEIKPVSKEVIESLTIPQETKEEADGNLVETGEVNKNPSLFLDEEIAKSLTTPIK